MSDSVQISQAAKFLGLAAALNSLEGVADAIEFYNEHTGLGMGTNWTVDLERLTNPLTTTQNQDGNRAMPLILIEETIPRKEFHELFEGPFDPDSRLNDLVLAVLPFHPGYIHDGTNKPMVAYTTAMKQGQTSTVALYHTPWWRMCVAWPRKRLAMCKNDHVDVEQAQDEITHHVASWIYLNFLYDALVEQRKNVIWTWARSAEHRAELEDEIPTLKRAGRDTIKPITLDDLEKRLDSKQTNRGVPRRF